MFQGQRQREIVSRAIEQGRVDGAALAREFRVTTETIRRDLSDLQKQRLVRRVHGGAVPWETSAFEPLLKVRKDQHDPEKQRIAQAAVAEIPDHGTIMIDSGSTLNRFASCVPADRELRVVTNSLLSAQALADLDAVEVVVLGGTLRKNTLAMVDSITVRAVADMSVDTLFISSDGVSAGSGLSTPYSEEAALKRAMVAAAKRVVVLVDHSKFGQEHFARFASWTDIDVLVTDAQTPATTLSVIEATGVSVVVA